MQIKTQLTLQILFAQCKSNKKLTWNQLVQDKNMKFSEILKSC